MASPKLDPAKNMARLSKVAWKALVEIKLLEKYAKAQAKQARIQVAGVSKRVRSEPLKPDMLLMLADEAVSACQTSGSDTYTCVELSGQLSDASYADIIDYAESKPMSYADVQYFVPACQTTGSDTHTCVSTGSTDLQSCAVSFDTFDDLVISPELDAHIKAILQESFVEMFGTD